MVYKIPKHASEVLSSFFTKYMCGVVGVRETTFLVATLGWLNLCGAGTANVGVCFFFLLLTSATATAATALLAATTALILLTLLLEALLHLLTQDFMR